MVTMVASNSRNFRSWFKLDTGGAPMHQIYDVMSLTFIIKYVE